MVTLAILIITCAVSLIYMNNYEFKNRYMFNAYAIRHRGEWQRFFTGALLHADGMHLAFNMLALYSFGDFVEGTFRGETMINFEYLNHELFGQKLGSLMFAVMYVTAIPLSSLFSYLKHKDNPHYNALGASGAVSAVVYSAILLNPLGQVSFFFIPLRSWIFGVLYLVVSWILARRNVGNIGHDAHFFGSVYGFIFPIIFFPFLAENFISALMMSFTR